MKRLFSLCIALVLITVLLAGCSINMTGNNQAGEINTSKFQSAYVGDYITFGVYEQDNNTANGEEPIEWLVLARESERILVISKYALDQVQLTNTASYVWENSNIRRWLNNDFLQTAFTAEDRELIKASIVPVDNHPNFPPDSANPTLDHIFLLGISEIDQYFPSSNAAICAPTEYAMAQGVQKIQGAGTGGKLTCNWVLRSHGSSLSQIASVECDGNVFDEGFMITYDYETNTVLSAGAIRPAMWITIS